MSATYRSTGHILYRVTSVTGDTTLTAYQGKEFVTVSIGAAATVTLPAISSFVSNQKEYEIVDFAGNAATYNITVAANSGETINGAASTVINTDDGAVSLASLSSTKWRIY